MISNSIFITGTDTDVGKTVLSLLIMQFFFAKGFSPFYLKPFQTGCTDALDTDSDAKFVYNHIPQLKKKNPADSTVFCFQNPKAPFFAARDQGLTIHSEKLQKVIQTKKDQFSPLIIEGAGGLFVPVEKDVMVIDIIEKTGVKPIIAAKAGLGTINHTLLSIEAMQHRNIPGPEVVFMDSGEKATPDEMIAENKEAIKTASGIEVAGVIRRISDFSRPAKSAMDVISNIFS